MNDKEFLGCIAAINALWQPPIQTKPELNIWNAILKDMDYYQVQKAIMVLAKKSQYRPTIASLNETIEELTGTKRMSATEAWGLVLKIGLSTYTSPERLDELPKEVRQALRNAGSYYNLARGDMDHARRAFMGAWNALGDTEQREHVQRIGSGMKQIGG